jgi:hypothetical protein
MNGLGLPKKSQKYWNISILILIVLLVFICFFQKSNKKVNFEDELNSEYRGIVVSKYIDNSDHAICKLTLRTGEIISVWGNCYEKVAINDSIVKNRGNFNFLIYKRSGVVVVNIKDNLIIPKE